MRILHYSLGFPPYRTGGLTIFCMDLMKQQIERGHEVALMWPGQMNLIINRISVRDRGNKYYDNVRIKSYEVINPLPISYDEGISEFDRFIYDGDIEVYKKFIDDYRPEVVHIHTLMGLHKAFLQAVNEKNIKLVFTAHDFFPICPKVTMFRNNQICNSIADCNECGICNTTALSIKEIYILQLPIYRRFKNTKFVKKIRKHHRDEYLSEYKSDITQKPVGEAKDYKKLRAHYESMLKYMGVVHYNSSVTKKVYEEYFGEMPGVIIPISHSNISDHRKLKIFSDDKIRIRYLGPYGGAKGFFYLKAALDKLWNERQNFCLDVQFDSPEGAPYIKSHGSYHYSELEDIFDKTDVLIAPSIWYETFGYTVLEALSYGVPVIISGTVGARDILADGAGIIIKNTRSDELYETLKDLTADKLAEMNKVIIEKQTIMTLSEMAGEIMDKCYL